MDSQYGCLEIQIDRAENLPNTDNFPLNIMAHLGKDLTDPFVTVIMGEMELFRTKYIYNDLNPKWKEGSVIPIYQELKDVIFNVRDKEIFGSVQVASVRFSRESLEGGNVIEGWCNLMHKNRDCGRIRISIQYFPKTAETILL